MSLCLVKFCVGHQLDFRLAPGTFMNYKWKPHPFQYLDEGELVFSLCGSYVIHISMRKTSTLNPLMCAEDFFKDTQAER